MLSRIIYAAAVFLLLTACGVVGAHLLGGISQADVLILKHGWGEYDQTITDVARNLSTSFTTFNIGTDRYSTWSPNGKYFLNFDDQTSLTTLIDTSDGKQIELDSFVQQAQHPSWSPDSHHIVFYTADKDRNIFVADIETQEYYPLAQTSKEEFYPSWSPDGQKIAFYREEEPDSFSINVVDLNGTVIWQQLASENGAIGVYMAPVWTADGNRLLFTKFLYEQIEYTPERSISAIYLTEVDLQTGDTRIILEMTDAFIHPIADGWLPDKSTVIVHYSDEYDDGYVFLDTKAGKFAAICERRASYPTPTLSPSYEWLAVGISIDAPDDYRPHLCNLRTNELIHIDSPGAITNMTWKR